jgi:hypothetical protein
MRLALELRGVPCLDLERDVPDRKSTESSTHGVTRRFV